MSLTSGISRVFLSYLNINMSQCDRCFIKWQNRWKYTAWHLRNASWRNCQSNFRKGIRHKAMYSILSER
nr:MAG TPA: hypothetical protein [Caudoviricetes sp.]